MKPTSREYTSLKNLLPLTEGDFRHFLRLWEKALELEVDSRLVSRDTLFYAQKGLVTDGHHFIPEVLKKKAVGVLADPTYPRQSSAIEKRIVRIPCLSDWAGKLGTLFYHHPSRQLRVVGITGTDGKTSTTRLLAHAYHSWGYKTAGIGTLGVYVVDDPDLNIPHQDTPNTTPDPIILQRILYSLHRRGVGTVIMEVSSHGLTLGRVQEIDFDSGIWTNLSPEHLDYHATLENYARTKSRLFELLGYSSKSDKSGVICLDSFLELAIRRENSTWVREIMERIKPQPYPIYFFQRGDQKRGRTWEKILSPTYQDRISYYSYKQAPSSVRKGSPSQEVHIRTGKTLGGRDLVFPTELIGPFNSQNIAAAFLELEIFRHRVSPRPPLSSVKRTWRHFRVKGRLEDFPLTPSTHPRRKVLGHCRLYIDYAHTPQALEKALTALRDTGKLGAPLLCVFGCGGNRDIIKRNPMGQVACRLAEISLITDDNPRSEDPKKIRDTIAEGWQEEWEKLSRKEKTTRKMEVISGRREAIRRALELVPAGGIILLAGKGHEDYQIIGRKKFPFDERVVLREELERQGTSDRVS